MPKESSHFLLTGDQKKLKESSHFSLAGCPKNGKRKFVLFNCRGHTFNLQGSGKMSKESSYFSLAGSYFSHAEGLKKCQKKVHTFQLQVIRKNTSFFGLHANEKCDPVQMKNFLSTWTNNKVCLLSVAHQKLKLSIHTEHKRVVVQWNLTLMDPLAVDWVKRQAKLFSLARSAIHTSTLELTRCGSALAHALVYSRL